MIMMMRLTYIHIYDGFMLNPGRLKVPNINDIKFVFKDSVHPSSESTNFLMMCKLCNMAHPS